MAKPALNGQSLKQHVFKSQIAQNLKLTSGRRKTMFLPVVSCLNNLLFKFTTILAKSAQALSQNQCWILEKAIYSRKDSITPWGSVRSQPHTSLSMAHLRQFHGIVPTLRSARLPPSHIKMNCDL